MAYDPYCYHDYSAAADLKTALHTNSHTVVAIEEGTPCTPEPMKVVHLQKYPILLIHWSAGGVPPDASCLIDGKGVTDLACGGAAVDDVIAVAADEDQFQGDRLLKR